MLGGPAGPGIQAALLAQHNIYKRLRLGVGLHSSVPTIWGTKSELSYLGMQSGASLRAVAAHAGMCGPVWPVWVT